MLLVQAAYEPIAQLVEQETFNPVCKRSDEVPGQQSTGNHEYTPDVAFASLPPRFTHKVRVEETGCWTWTASRNRDGYGMFAVSGAKRWTMVAAHRLACESAHGPAPTPDSVAMHLCDQPGCVNPAHLRWGTQSENISDAYAKGRKRSGYTAGMRKQCGLCRAKGHDKRTCPSAAVQS